MIEATQNRYIMDLKANIATRNAAFKKMTPAQRRVAVAKDVLLSIQFGVIEPTEGVYVIQEDCDFNKIPIGENMQNVLLENVNTCQCCAKGAFFIAKVMGHNHCKVSPELYDTFDYFAIGNDRGIISALDDVFTKRQLNVIENAFEQDEVNSSMSENDVFYRAVNMYYNITSARDRLIAICNNIINNSGEFVVP